MRVGTPHSIDETLLNEVVDVLSVLNEQDVYIVLQSQGRVNQRRVVGCRALSHPVKDVWLEVRPKKAAHTLDGVTYMVWRRHVDSVPA